MIQSLPSASRQYVSNHLTTDSDFAYDAEGDLYVCPGGKELRKRRRLLAGKIARSIYEAARDQARTVAKTEAYAVSCRQRKKVEMLFAPEANPQARPATPAGAKWSQR
jgi:hypothetical protein